MHNPRPGFPGAAHRRLHSLSGTRSPGVLRGAGRLATDLPPHVVGPPLSLPPPFTSENHAPPP